MNTINELIQRALTLRYARKAPPMEMSEKGKAAFERMLFGSEAKQPAESANALGVPSDKDAVQPKVLKANEMRLVILKTLTESTATGSEIIDRLAELHLEFEVKGDGAIFGILHGMTETGVIETRFEESTATTRYQITDAGTGLLNREGATAFSAHGLSMLWNPK